KPVIIFISIGPVSMEAKARGCRRYAEANAGYHFQVTQKPASWAANAGACGRWAGTRTGDHGVRGRKSGGKNKP
ncbi:MAG: hypothetical protein KAX47_10860, partial [Zoogloea sp.]|nr:hypothetical protein [Zoogloea sp.]